MHQSTFSEKLKLFGHCLFVCAIFFSLPIAMAQASTNRVLDLNGPASYLELPVNTFSTFETATIEGWVRWPNLSRRSSMKLFEAGSHGAANSHQLLGIGITRSDRRDLFFEIFSAPATAPQHVVLVEDILRDDEWAHIAGVTGKQGMHLYFNGLLVGTNDVPHSFPILGSTQANVIGGSSTAGWSTQAQLDEVRIWNRALSGDEIWANIGRKLSGTEEGLEGYWTFDDANQPGRDFSPRGRHGRAQGVTRTVLENIPPLESLRRPAIISGHVLDGDGRPIKSSRITLERRGKTLYETESDLFQQGSTRPRTGQFRFAVDSDGGDYELVVTSGSLGARRLFSVKSGETAKLDLNLEPASPISGAVTALDGLPQGGMGVQLVRIDPTGERTPLESTSTDAKGTYQFVNFPAGRYEVRCLTPSTVPSTNRIRVIEIANLPARSTGSVAASSATGIDFRFAPAKKGTWKRFNVGDGLAGENVEQLRLDGSGRLWVTTHTGVSVYDGSEFRLIAREDGLASNQTAALYEDGAGSMWIGMNGGVARLSKGAAGPGRIVQSLTVKDGLLGGWVNMIFQDRQGTYWFATFEGISRFDGRQIVNFTSKDGLISDWIWDIRQTKDGLFWIGGRSGLSRYDGTNFVQLTRKDGYPGGLVFRFHEDTDGTLWIASINGLFKYERGTFTRYTTKDGLPDNWITTIHRAADGRLWVGTRGGAARLEGDYFVRYTTVDGLPDNNVWALTSTPDGTVWFGSIPGGICSYSESEFAHFDRADGLPDNRLRSVYAAPSGDIWVSFEPRDVGACRFDGKEFKRVTTADGLADNWLDQVITGHDGGLWFATFGGLSRLDGSRFINFTAANGLPESDIENIAITPDGTFWLAHWMQGVSHFDPLPGRTGNRRLAHFTTADGLLTNNVRRVFLDSTGVVWAATGIGLARIESGKITMLTTTNGLPDNDISRVASDRAGRIWVLTQTGPARIEGTNVTTFQQRNLRGTFFSAALHVDSAEIVWIGNSSGVTRYDGTNWVNLTESDGLPVNDIRGISEDPKGHVWFATSKGLTRYRPSRTPPRTPEMIVKTDREYLAGEAIPPLPQNSRVVLKYNGVDLRTRPEIRRYRHLVARGRCDAAGIKARTDWSAPVADVQAEWVSAAPGEYTFAVQYIDRDLNYSEPALAFLTVLPPWYLNARIAVPVFGTFAGLVGWAFIARFLYMSKRREAQRLREEMIAQEHNALLAMEQKNAELQEAIHATEEARKLAEAASQAKSEFLANMSHEIRTPMNAILGFTELLGHLSSGPKQRHYLEAISSSGKTLLTLINDILDLSKIEAGKLELHYEPISVSKIIDEIIHVFSVKASQKGLTLMSEIDASLPSGLMFDEVRLRQILFNVVGNALKFTEKGHVKIRAWAEAGDQDEAIINLHLSVEDTGIGIPDEKQDQLFQPFTQVSGRTARKFGGTGLGLAITRRLTEMMGGTVSLASEQGRGSAFSFIFPAIAIVPEVQVHTPTPVIAGDFGQFAPATVLVADDVALNRELVSGYFEGSHHQLIMAANGRQAIDLAHQHKPNVILMDMRMPEMDGYEATAAIKADPELKHIIVIALTASSFREDEARARRICDGYLRKPFNQAGLIAELAKFLPRATGKPGAPTALQPRSESAGDRQSVPVEIVAIRPRLLNQLSEQVQTILPRLLQTMDMGDLEKFAKQMSEIAKDGAWPILRDYAARLDQQVQEFDIDQLPQTLREFETIVHNLKSAS